MREVSLAAFYATSSRLGIEVGGLFLERNKLQQNDNFNRLYLRSSTIQLILFDSCSSSAEYEAFEAES